MEGAQAARELLRLRRQPDFPTAFIAYNGLMARGAINIAMYPLNDVRIRKALAFATNYKGFLDSLWFGIGNISNGMETPASWAWNSKVPKMREDLAEAKKLLSAAGEGDGKNVWPMVTPNTADSIATCE